MRTFVDVLLEWWFREYDGPGAQRCADGTHHIPWRKRKSRAESRSADARVFHLWPVSVPMKASHVVSRCCVRRTCAQGRRGWTGGGCRPGLGISSVPSSRRWVQPTPNHTHTQNITPLSSQRCVQRPSPPQRAPDRCSTAFAFYRSRSRGASASGSLTLGARAYTRTSRQGPPRWALT